MTNPTEDVFRHRDKLSEWMATNSTVPPNGRNGNLADIDLREFALPGARFDNAQMPNATLIDCVLTEVRFDEANLTSAKLDGANLARSRFNRANLTDASMLRVSAEDSHWGSAVLKNVTATGSVFDRAEFNSAQCQGADLRSARFKNATLSGAHLGNTDLRSTSFRNAELTNTVWTGATLNAATDLSGAVWQPVHDSPNDGAGQIDLPWWRRWLVNWEAIRFVGKLPLFAGSYLLLTISLLIATAIDWVNTSQALLHLSYPVPFPERLISLLVGSASLAVGTTVFEFACPARVKEYTMTRWVEELRRPGVLYVSDGLL